MLSDAQIERYSRQILLPEVGGRGQERLLAARVGVDGHGPAAAMAATLLGRAGVGMVQASPRLGPIAELSPDCRLSRSNDPADVDAVLCVVDGSPSDESDEGIWGVLFHGGGPFVFASLDRTRIVVATLVGRPCMGCLPHHPRWPGPFMQGTFEEPVAVPVRLALGALAAAETLRVLLAPPNRGRLTTLDLGDGTAAATELERTDGCAACGTSA